MSGHAALVAELADRLRRREITSLVYFHTDHFEPWRSIGDRVPAVGPEIVDGVHEFLRTTERMEFARRLTLFYKPHLNYALRRDAGLFRADPEDLVAFLPRSDTEERFGHEAMRPVGASGHEIQVHVHHEYYTATTAHTDPEARAWFHSPLGALFDPQRLELALRLNREIIERETGRPLDRWFFVHGHWALNASDDTSCTIVNEIEILQRNGCLGDFTFPGGRPHVNPRIPVPYFCRPLRRAKGYDDPAAEPETVVGNRAAAASKFFIWSCAATSQQCSLDYMSESGRNHLENTEKAAKALLDGSYAAGRTLYIKTHAHSMHQAYYEHAPAPVIPHQHPAVQRLLSVIFEAAAQAGAEPLFLTASEVYRRLLSATATPEADLAATYLRPGRFSLAAAPSAPRRAIRSGPFADAATVEILRETVVDVLEERIERLGVRGSGAYEHYAHLLRQGFPLPQCELAALDLVRRELPGLSAYHEIGSGLGTLPFLLALNGFPAAGIERDRRRHEAAQAIWRELAARSGLPDDDCRLGCAFPHPVMRDELSQSMAIVTDFYTTQSAAQYAAILAGLRRYRFVLIDLRRFVAMRRTAEERTALIEELSSAGLTLVREAAGQPVDDYAFALFSSDKAAIDRRDAGAKPARLGWLRRRMAAPAAGGR